MKLHLFSLFLLILSCTPKNESANDVVLFEPLLISTAAPEFSFTINADNNLLFFNRTNEDRSTIKIMMSKLVDDKWQAAEELSFSNGKYRDVDPFLAHDGKRLYFSSTRPVTEGGSEKDFDTWYVEKAENGWSEPINPGAPLNSDSTEIFFTMSKNGNAYFASEFDGQRGIAFSRFKDGAYQPMERITLRLNGVAVEAGNP
ncbi:MAG: PD40 domain-containing protein, partial [Calditrichaeota bacterium]|nr:PD40 domain-containing protein [Calditrichota bacterium]